MRAITLSLLTLILTAPLAATTENIRVEDPAGNLIGDSRRAYVDITEVRIRQQTASMTVEIRVDTSFPEPSTLLGTGMQFVFTFMGTDEKSEALLECRLELDDKGWSVHGDDAEEDPLPVDFRVGSDEVTLSFPVSILHEAVSLVIVANTANRPKWKPLTTNPPILLDLPPRPETAIR